MNAHALKTPDRPADGSTAWVAVHEDRIDVDGEKQALYGDQH